MYLVLDKELHTLTGIFETRDKADEYVNKVKEENYNLIKKDIEFDIFYESKPSKKRELNRTYKYMLRLEQLTRENDTFNTFNITRNLPDEYAQRCCKLEILSFEKGKIDEVELLFPED